MPYPALLERKSGTLSVDVEAVEFLPDDGGGGRALRIPLSELGLGSSGENNQFFLLFRQGAPEPAISVQDPAVLGELRRNGVKEAAAVLAAAARRRSHRRLLLGLFAFLLLFLLAVLPYAVSKIPGRWIESAVSMESEKRLGLILADSDRFLLDGSEAAREKLGRIVEFLQRSNPELASLSIDVRVNRTPEVNAFALPGGILGVNTGFINEARSIEEVMGVMGHELGHIQERHVIKGLTGNLGFIAGAGLVGLIISPEAAGWLLRGGELALLKHSRDHELEADRRALEYLRDAGVSAQGAITFFERMHAQENVPAMLSLLSTHPVSADRLAAMKEFLKANPYQVTAEPPVSLEELQASVR
jgi:beta-barrel assembly-enhancing protease